MQRFRKRRLAKCVPHVPHLFQQSRRPDQQTRSVRTTSATSAYSSLGVSLSVAKSGACCTDGSDCNVFLKCRSQLIVGLWDYTFYKTLTAKSLQNYLKQTMNIIFIKSVLLWSWNMYYATLLGNWPHRKGKPAQTGISGNLNQMVTCRVEA